MEYSQAPLYRRLKYCGREFGDVIQLFKSLRMMEASPSIGTFASPLVIKSISPYTPRNVFTINRLWYDRRRHGYVKKGTTLFKKDAKPAVDIAWWPSKTAIRNASDCRAALFSLRKIIIAPRDFVLEPRTSGEQ
jgi:hypothetical protein